MGDATLRFDLLPVMRLGSFIQRLFCVRITGAIEVSQTCGMDTRCNQENLGADIARSFIFMTATEISCGKADAVLISSSRKFGGFWDSFCKKMAHIT